MTRQGNVAVGVGGGGDDKEVTVTAAIANSIFWIVIGGGDFSMLIGGNKGLS